MDWNEHLAEIIKFKKQWGHCDVPQKYDKKPKLGQQVKYQRSQYRLFKCWGGGGGGVLYT